MTVQPRPQIFVNGKRVNSDRAFRLSFHEDQIFVFESLKSYGGVIFHLKEHLERLFESAKTIGLKLPKTRDQFEAELNHCLQLAVPILLWDAFLRLAADEENTYIWILDRKRPSWIYTEGVCLKTAVPRRNFVNAAPSEPKTSAFFNNVLVAMEQGEKDIDESIILDSNGYVTEATIWNLFFVKGKALFTPAVGILHGVTRQFVIKCAEKNSLPVFELNLTRHDFWNAEEAFLTNTSGEIVPIRSLDGRTIGTSVPGAVTKKLMTRFRSELEKELRRNED